MKITNLINTILYEEDKKEEDNSKMVKKVDSILKSDSKKQKPKEGMFAKTPQKKEKGLKVIYNIKANIADTGTIMSSEPEGGGTVEPVTTEVTPELPVGAATPTTEIPPVSTNPLLQSTKESGETLNEEVYSFSKNGEIIIPKTESVMISSLEALVDFISKDEASKKGAIIDDVMSNVLLIASGVNGSKQLTSVIKKEDYIFCSIDCGNSVEDSIGLLLRKVAGVNLVSMNLKKDGNILAAFSLQDFNSELIRYVNDLKNESK